MNWPAVVKKLRETAESYPNPTGNSARVFVLLALADALEYGWSETE